VHGRDGNGVKLECCLCLADRHRVNDAWRGDRSDVCEPDRNDGQLYDADQSSACDLAGSNRHAVTDADCNPERYPDRHTHGDPYCYAYSDSQCYANRNPNRNSNGDANRNSNGDANRDSNGNSNGDANTQSNACGVCEISDTSTDRLYVPIPLFDQEER
jgi:hypothetical protein